MVFKSLNDDQRTNRSVGVRHTQGTLKSNVAFRVKKERFEQFGIKQYRPPDVWMALLLVSRRWLRGNCCYQLHSKPLSMSKMATLQQ